MSGARRLAGAGFAATLLSVSLVARAGHEPSLPADVQAFVQRVDECAHWTGEEPYDRARAKEIADAIADLGCAEIEQTRDLLFEKYRSDPDVQQTILLAE